MYAYPRLLVGRLLIARGEGGMDAVIRNTLSGLTLFRCKPRGSAQWSETIQRPSGQDDMGRYTSSLTAVASHAATGSTGTR
jgi:hypothetical protein